MNERILVLTGSSSLREQLCGVLFQVGLASRSFGNVDEVVAALDEADAGALLLSAEVLTCSIAKTLLISLENQPPWSDLPVVVVGSRNLPAEGSTTPGTEELGAVGNLTLLDPDPDPKTLVMTLTSKLRARRRQYQVRDAMAWERAARVRAERASSDKDQLVAQICHELQTPVSAMILWSRLASSGTLPPSELHQALVSIESSARAQAYQLRTLLDASVLASGTLKLDQQPASLAGLVEAAVHSIRALAAFKGIQLEVALDSAAAPALADSERLQRVVWSLLSRAIKRSPPGETVRVRLRSDQAGPQIDIADSSSPSEPDESPDLLDIAFAVGKEIVALHGGTLQIVKRRVGTVVSVALPACAP